MAERDTEGPMAAGGIGDGPWSEEAARSVLTTLPDLLRLLADVRQQGDRARRDSVAAQATAASAVAEAKKLRDEIDVVVATQTACEVRIHALLSELAEAGQAVAAADQRHLGAAAQAEANRERAESAAAQAEANRERAESAAAEAEANRERALSAEAEAGAAWARAAAAEGEVHSLKSTRSWRLTRPVRRLETAARKIRRGGPSPGSSSP